jgi:hypothetical protein
MRLNVYSQELILDRDSSVSAVSLVEQEADTGVIYCGVRLFLHSSDRLHDRPDDDDRSAITFWLPKSDEKRTELARLFGDLAALVLIAPQETGLD